MLLALGSQHIDITHRAIVVRVVELSEEVPDSAERLADEGADAIEIVVPPGPEAHADDQGALLERCVRVLRATGGRPVAVRAPTASLRSVASSAGAVDLDAQPGLIVSTVDIERDRPDEALAQQVLAIVRGARIVRTSRVRSTRRVAAVTARLLAARSGSPGAAT